MFDLIGAGISIVGGLLGKSSADKEKKAANRQQNKEIKAAKKIGSAKAKMFDEQISRTNEQYTEQKEALYKSRNATLGSLSAQKNAEIAAIDLKYEGAIKANEITKESFGVDRKGNSLMANAYLEQQKQDLIQIQLGQDEQDRQFKENVRAAELQADYSRLAAKRELEAAETDVKDYKRAFTAQSATELAMQAASGVQREGSPMLVDEARMTEMMIGASRILHEGDEQFMSKMQEVNEINQYVHTQKENVQWNKVTGLLNKKGIKARTALELQGNKIALKTIGIQEKAASEDFTIAGKVKNLSIKTAKDLYAANKSSIKADADSAKKALYINRTNTVASLDMARYDAKSGMQGSISTSRATGAQRSNAASSAGVQSLVGGVGSALNTIQSGSTLQSLSAKGGGWGGMFR